jgi:hypothetical protein
LSEAEPGGLNSTSDARELPKSSEQPNQGRIVFGRLPIAPGLVDCCGATRAREFRAKVMLISLRFFETFDISCVFCFCAGFGSALAGNETSANASDRKINRFMASLRWRQLTHATRFKSNSADAICRLTRTNR